MEGRDSWRLMERTRCFKWVKVVMALLRSMGLWQMSIRVVSLTWSSTIVWRTVCSSGRLARHARVVARRTVAVRLVWPTTWKGRFNFSLLRFGVN